MRSRRWSELTSRQRVGVVVMTLIQFGLAAAALIDLERRPADQIRGRKRTWVGIIGINYIGPILYFVRGRRPGPSA
jgi:hypothetical protein